MPWKYAKQKSKIDFVLALIIWNYCPFSASSSLWLLPSIECSQWYLIVNFSLGCNLFWETSQWSTAKRPLWLFLQRCQRCCLLGMKKHLCDQTLLAQSSHLHLGQACLLVCTSYLDVIVMHADLKTLIRCHFFATLRLLPSDHPAVIG